MQQVQHPNAVKSVPVAALQREAALPANCFSLNGNAALREGVDIQLGHVMTGGIPALIVGEYYILRDMHGRGCLYKPGKSIGTVRRMVIERHERQVGKPIPFLRQPTGDNLPLYLNVDPTVELGKGVKASIRFWTGVKYTGCKEIARDQMGYERFLEFKSYDSTVDVYYADGRVIRIVRTKDGLVDAKLTIEQQADLRIANALEGIEAAKKDLVGDDQIKRIDKILHEVVEVLKIGGARSEVVFEKVYDLLETAAEEGRLRLGVREHVLNVLRARSEWQPYALRFHAAITLPPRTPRRELGGQTNITPKAKVVVTVGTKPKGPPAERKAKIAARAQRDSDIRDAMKGVGGGGSNKRNKK